MIESLKNKPNNLLALFFILVFMLILILSSCATREKCNQLFPPSTKDSIIYIIKDSVSYRDTTIYIPGNTITLRDTIVDCADFEKELEDARTKLRIIVRKGRLTATCECKELEVKFRVYEHWHTLVKSHDRLELRTAATKRKHWLSFWESWAAIGLLIVFIGGFIFKKIGLKLAFTITPPFITIVKR